MADFQCNWAVVIGINDYQNQVPKLKTAKNDAEQLANILAQSHQYEVILITDDTECKPTLDRLLNLLEKQLPEKINKDDRLLFYFAGHGIAKESDRGPAGFLVPQDTDLNNEATLLPMQTLHDRLTALKCRHLLVILDCCFAGTFRWSITRLATVIPRKIHKEHYDRFINSPAWQAITSASHNQEAYDINPINSNNRQTVPGTNHSPFAEALFKALQGEADIMPPAQKNKPAGDGVITATELSQYLQYRVAEIAGDRQTTQLWPLPKHNRGEYIFLHPDRPRNLKDAPKLNKDNNPYRGLESFEEKHAQFFFGRKELIEKLLARISQPQGSLTVVLGVSGSGKSSLVKAGLIPCLKHLSKLEVFQINFVGAGILAEAIACSLPQFFLKFLPLDYIHQWRILRPMRPGESPFAALARIILPITEIPVSERLNSIDFLRELFQKKLEQLNHKLNEFIDSEQESDEQFLLNQEREKFHKFATIWNNSNSRSKMLLLVEDFEELYELCKETEKQDTQTKETKQQEELRLAFWDCLNPLSQRLQSEHKQFVNIVQKWSKNYPGIKLLLAIDQFEELITLSRDEQKDKKSNKQPEWQQFLQLLEEVIAANLEQLRIVVTLRSDFEPRFLNSDALKSHWAKARFPVRPMRSDELRQAIERPAAEMALYFEPANLVDRLIEEVGQMPGALPLLSFTLSEFYIKLYEKWVKDGSSDRALRIDADFEKEGGVAGSLTRRANQEYNELADDAHRDTMRRVMLRMVTLEGGEPVRRRVSLSELVYANKQEPNQPDKEENQRVKVVLECLHNARLVVSGQETGEPYIEPAHDFLVKGWDKLKKWLEKEQENLLLQRRLTTVAFEWKKKEQAPSLSAKTEPFLTILDKKIDFAEEWLKQIKDREVQELIQKTQIKLQQATTKWKSNEKVSSFLTKTAPVLQFLNKIFDFPENWRTKIRPQNTQERPREKKVQFLWNGNPYLDVLRKTLKSSDYWFNQVEAEFVQQSIWQRRRVGNFIRGSVIVVILGLSRLTIWALTEQRIGVIGVMNTARQSSETGLRSDYLTLDTLIQSLQAAQSSKHWLLQISPPAPQLKSQVVSTLLRAFYLKKEQQRWQLPPDEVVKDTLVTGNGKLLLATTKNENTICAGDVKNRQCATIPANLGSVIDAKLSPDGTKLALMSEKFAGIYLWERANNKFHILSGLPGAVESVYFSLNSQALALISRNQDMQSVAYFWNLNSRKSYRLANIQGNVKGISFKPNGHLLVATTTKNDDNKTVRLWDYTFGKPKQLHMLKTDFPVDKTIISPNGDSLVIILGSARSSGVFSQLWNASDSVLKDLGGSMNVVYSSDGKQLTIADSDGTIRVLYSNGLELVKLKGHQGSVSHVSHDREMKQLFSVGNDQTIRLWNIEDRQLSKFQELPNPVQKISFSPDGKQLATLEAGAVHLWDVSPSLQHKTKLPQTYNPESNVTFSPDGTQLAIVEEKTIYLWDLSLGKNVRKYTGDYNPESNVTFTPDGTQLAIIDSLDYQSTLHLLDLKNQNTKVQKYDFKEGHIQGAFWKKTDKANQLIISSAGFFSNSPNTINIRNFFSREQLAGLPIGQSTARYIHSSSFNNDGSLVAIGLRNLIILWDLQSNQSVRLGISSSETGTDGNTSTVKFSKISPDGSVIATIDENGKAELWQLGQFDELLKQGCQQVRDYLTTLDDKNSDRHLCDGIGNSQR